MWRPICFNVLCIHDTFYESAHFWVQFAVSFTLSVAPRYPSATSVRLYFDDRERLQYQSVVTHRDKLHDIYCKVILVLIKREHLIPCLNLLWLGSTHLRDPRTTSNPSSPSSSPHTPSALGSGSSDPVLNGGLCSAAYCSSAGGRYTQIERYASTERENQSPHRGPSGSHYGIVSRCHPAVVRKNGRRFVVPPLLQLQLDVGKCLARVVMSHSTFMCSRHKNFWYKTSCTRQMIRLNHHFVSL